MQLERILQKQGFGARKVCRFLIRHGRVSVLGKVRNDPFAELATEGLVFSVDGQEWPYREFATVLFHKPFGYECSRKPTHHPDILALLPLPLRTRGIQPIGRLDTDTTGLLILTDDGQLNHRLSSPRYKVPKVYRVDTDEAVDAGQIAALLAGVVLHDDPVPVRAAAVEQVASHTLRLTITQGKYHQVKRMVGAVGNRVVALHRESLGGLTLDGLTPGQWRWLEDAALQNLFPGPSSSP